MPVFTDRELELIGIAAREAAKSPRLTINEKIMTAGITLIGIFFVALVASILCAGIVLIWNFIL
jgi:hypothetical protein